MCADSLVIALSGAFNALPTVQAVLLFGSAAAGTLRADSDLDLAVLFDDAAMPTTAALLALRADLERMTNREVDLVVLNQASPILAFQAVKKGMLVSCRDRHAYERFVVRLISAYADLKQVRRPIEEAVLARRLYA